MMARKLSHCGLSLIELMISVALGSVLILGVTTLLLNAQRNYVQQEQRARLQENGRYALRLLTRELGMSGYFGSALPNEIKNTTALGGGCFSVLRSIQPALLHFDDIDEDGVSAIGTNFPMACARRGSYQAGSDALLVTRTLDQPHIDRGQSLRPTESESIYLSIDNWGTRLQRGPTASVDDQSLWQYHPQLLFIRQYSREPGDGIPVLCRTRISPQGDSAAPVECLVEGIEMLQLEYGLDTDGDLAADSYVSSPGESQLRQAVLAKVYLLARSLKPLPGHEEQRVYQLGASTYRTPDDGYYRRLYSTAVLLRNSSVYRG